MLSDQTTPLSMAFLPQMLPLAFILDDQVDCSGVAGAEGAGDEAAVRRGGGGGAAIVACSTEADCTKMSRVRDERSSDR